MKFSKLYISNTFLGLLGNDYFENNDYKQIMKYFISKLCSTSLILDWISILIIYMPSPIN